MLFFFSFVYATFLNSRCIFELKFAIYHRAASLSSQASSVDVVLAEESLTRHLFKCWVNTSPSCQTFRQPPVPHPIFL